MPISRDEFFANREEPQENPRVIALCDKIDRAAQEARDRGEKDFAVDVPSEAFSLEDTVFGIYRQKGWSVSSAKSGWGGNRMWHFK